MTKQPRDKNGRFVGKKENKSGWTIAIVLIGITMIIGMIAADIFAYNRGYQTGLSDNQPDIYQNGFNAGSTQQKNIDELARNWTVCWWWARDDSVYCRNDDPDNVRIIHDDYSTRLEYTKPNWTNVGCSR